MKTTTVQSVKLVDGLSIADERHTRNQTGQNPFTHLHQSDASRRDRQQSNHPRRNESLPPAYGSLSRADASVALSTLGTLEDAVQASTLVEQIRQANRAMIDAHDVLLDGIVSSPNQVRQRPVAYDNDNPPLTAGMQDAAMHKNWAGSSIDTFPNDRRQCIKPDPIGALKELEGNLEKLGSIQTLASRW